MFFNSLNAGAIKSKPMNLHFGRRHVYKIVPTADESSSLAGAFFKMELAKPTALNEANKAKLAVYFVVGGTGADPMVEGHTGVPVTIAADATKTAVMTALETALKAIADVKLVFIQEGALYVEGMWFGKVSPIADGATATDFTFTDSVLGFGGFLGATEGGVEITPEIETEDITSDQTGTIPLTTIIKSTKYSVKTTMKELTEERMELLFGQLVGESFLPAGVGSSKIIGLGTSKVGSNVSAYLGELILKPVSKEATDHSENIHFFQTAILPGGLNYGQETLKTEATFSVYIDPSKDKRTNLGCFGNGFQDLRPAV